MRGPMKRTTISAIGLALIFIGCGHDAPPRTGGEDEGFVSDQRIVYHDGLHNENTEMIRIGDRILLIFRGGETGQSGSARARIKIFESTDEGQSFALMS